MVRLCKQLGVTYLNITPLIDSGEATTNWDSLELDNYKLFDAIEEVVRYASEIHRSLNINIEARPWVVWYLRLRHPMNVTYSLGHTMCKVLDDLLYIKADGDLHPCGLYTFKAGKEAQKRDILTQKTHSI